MLNSEERKRYERHLQLKNFGEEAQLKLKAARVLLIGAGGLGCPAIQYLTAAGVGTIGIADDDQVSVSNLQRQILYGPSDVGQYKSVLAAKRARVQNPHIRVIAYNERLTPDNTLDIIRDYDIVADCTDNFDARYMIGDATAMLKKTLVCGSVFRYEGQIAVFNRSAAENELAPTYRCLYPDKGERSSGVNCSEEGVLGVVPGVVGTLMATEIIKLITGIGESLRGKLMLIDLLSMRTQKVEFSCREESRSEIPSSEEAFRSRIYQSPNCLVKDSVALITCAQFDRMLHSGAPPLIIDVRPNGELPAATGFDHHVIPLDTISESDITIFNGRDVVFFCKAGKRSVEAIRKLTGRMDTSRCYSLEGGILAWEKYLSTICKTAH